MFRWLEHLVARFRSAESAPAGWVEPSNAITRAVLAGAVAALPALTVDLNLEVEAEADDVTAMPDRALPAAAPATRTAQRTRRRRAGRAA